MQKLFFVLLLFLSLSLCGFAQGEPPGQAPAAHESEAPHEESAFATVFRWLNFLVLFGGLGYLLKKPATEFFEARRRGISEGLNKARRAQEDAQARMTEIERRLASLGAEMAALRVQADKESAVERARIVAEARAEVARVVEQSRQEIERVARSVERDIKEQLASQVIDRATQSLRTEMTQDDHRRVVVRFIKNL